MTSKPNSSDKFFSWGIGLIVLGLAGLILPTFGLQLRRLRGLGELQWVFLLVIVAVGCGALLWSRRQQIRLAALITAGALTLSLLFAYLSFWRHPKDVAIAGETQGVSTSGTAAAEFKMLEVTFENVQAHDDFATLMELMRDATPEGHGGGGGVQGEQDPQTGKFVATSQQFSFGPVTDVDAVVQRIQFGKVTRKNDNRLAINVRYPLPSPAASIQHRVDYALQQLRSGDAQRQATGVRVLDSLEPLDRRDEVANELLPLVANPPAMLSVTQTLTKWGTSKQAPAICALFDAPKAMPHELLLILESISPDDAVREAIKLMPKDQHIAVESLRRVGPRSEGPVALLLADSDPSVQRAACWVLQVVGTKSSLEALEKLQSSAPQEIAAEARHAIELIQKRAK